MKLALLLLLASALHAAVLNETTFEAEGDPTVYTNFADSTDQACSGSESAKTTSTTAAIGWTKSPAITFAYVRAYIYPTARRSTTEEFIEVVAGSGESNRCGVILETDGRLTTFFLNGTNNTSTATVPLNQWSVIVFLCDANQAGATDIARVWLNDLTTPVAQTTNGDDAGFNFNRVRIRSGITASDPYYVDDVLWDDSTAPGYSAGCGDPRGGRRRVLISND